MDTTTVSPKHAELHLSCLGSFSFYRNFIFCRCWINPYDLYLDIHIFFALNAFRLMVQAVCASSLFC